MPETSSSSTTSSEGNSEGNSEETNHDNANEVDKDTETKTEPWKTEKRYMILKHETTVGLQDLVNKTLKENSEYYLYHGVQKFDTEKNYQQTLVKLPSTFGKEMWKMFNNLNGKHISVQKDKERYLASTAAIDVIKNLSPMEKRGEKEKEKGEKEVKEGEVKEGE